MCKQRNLANLYNEATIEGSVFNQSKGSNYSYKCKLILVTLGYRQEH